MTSILKVGEVQHTNGTSALTINTQGYLSPKVVAFHARYIDSSVGSLANALNGGFSNRILTKAVDTITPLAYSQLRQARVVYTTL